MKGTERIIAHIEAEAKAEAQTVLAKAAEEAQQIRASYFKTALTEHKRLVDEARPSVKILLHVKSAWRRWKPKKVSSP